MLDRALNSIASIYRDVAVLQNNAEDSVGLINLENRSSITELSVRLTRGERCGGWRILPLRVAVWPAMAIPYWSLKLSSAPHRQLGLAALAHTVFRGQILPVAGGIAPLVGVLAS